MSAIDNVKHKEEHETFYKKVGKRYVKINDPFQIEGLTYIIIYTRSL